MTASYRLQLHRDFTFSDASSLVPYLADLGITTLYLSPVLQSTSGSRHGYDVVDHDRIDGELGGEHGLIGLAAAAHARGLSLLVDIVPNHVALAAPEYDAPALWELLAKGRKSPTSHWFDIDWVAGEGKITLPVLAADPKVAIDDGTLRIDSHDGHEVIVYEDHVFPIADGTKGPDVETLLEHQHYRMTSWREADRLNYRRFFAVSSLIAVRVELPDVFEATHRLLLELHRDGVIDGFRVDHPDGLADPEGYLKLLRSRLRPGTPLYVEKILQGEEPLPTSWPCEGTTGYEAIRAISLALADSSALPVLDRTWAATGGPPALPDAVDEAKRYVVDRLLSPETARLTRRAAEALNTAEDAVEEAVRELLVSSEVYRAYVDSAPAAVSPYRRTVLEAVARAGVRRPELADTLRLLADVALDPQGEAAVDFSVRLQQLWSAILAKAVEDTAFYRWHRLVALNEVGGEPGALGAGDVDSFHTWAAQREAHWPAALTPLSTHDTKRSEDVRARILAVAADHEAWKHCSEVFARAADELTVDRVTAHLVWQTMVGAGDIEPERLNAALVKSVREAAQHTTWTDPVDDYEQRVLRLADLARGPGRMREALTAAVSRNQHRIRALVLGQKATQLLMPGVPDLYQGTELVDLSLVDPDNRRPVDFEARQQAFAKVCSEDPVGLDEEKLYLTSRLLWLRQELPDAFGPQGRYAPLTAESWVGGPPAPILGFLRGDRVACLVNRAGCDGQWLIERVHLPDGIWRDRLTGQVYSSIPATVACSELFARFPVAVLVRDP